MEAYELPKLMPTTGGSFETTAIGSSALPFGTAISSLVVLVQGLFQQKKKIKLLHVGLRSRGTTSKRLSTVFVFQDPAITYGLYSSWTVDTVKST